MKITKLSAEMQRCIDALKAHGVLKRYDGGFWHIPNCEMKARYNGGRIEYYVPIHPTIEYFGTNTMNALANRKLIKASKKATSQYGEYAVEYILNGSDFGVSHACSTLEDTEKPLGYNSDEMNF